MTTTTSAQLPLSSFGQERDDPWSYSRLSAFELCPKKFAAETVYKNVRRTEGEAQAYGKDVHKALEWRAKKGKKLPLDLQHHEEKVAKLLSMIPDGQVLAEVSLGIDSDFRQCDFFANDVWCRGRIDLICHNEEKALVVDWKTGRVKPDYDQLDLMAALTSCLLPSIEVIVGVFYWTKERTTSHRKYERDDFDAIWDGFLKRNEIYQEALRTKDFPARQNFLCRKFCPVSGCKHHGVG